MRIQQLKMVLSTAIQLKFKNIHVEFGHLVKLFLSP